MVRAFGHVHQLQMLAMLDEPGLPTYVSQRACQVILLSGAGGPECQTVNLFDDGCADDDP